MLTRLLVLFIVVPLVELTILLWLSSLLPWQAVLLLVICTGILGAFLARWQGLRSIARVQRELSEGRMPTAPLLDGLMIVLAAVLLATPGVMTDGIGFSLLIPACRRWYRRRVSNWLAKRFRPTTPHSGPESTSTPTDRIIEGVVLDPKKDPTSEDG